MPCNNQSTDKIPTINYSKQNLPHDQTFFFFSPQYMLTSQIEEKKAQIKNPFLSRPSKSKIIHKKKKKKILKS